jgi:hypothetical protein
VEFQLDEEKISIRDETSDRSWAIIRSGIAGINTICYLHYPAIVFVRFPIGIVTFRLIHDFISAVIIVGDTIDRVLRSGIHSKAQMASVYLKIKQNVINLSLRTMMISNLKNSYDNFLQIECLENQLPMH